MTDRDTAPPSIRDRAGEAIDSARERAIEAYDSALDNAREAGRNAGEKVSDAPLAALGGGLALGALIAALLPVTRRERQMLGPVSDRIRSTASEAVDAARDAGQAKLDELGLTREHGGDIVRKVVDGAGEALRESARAAYSTVRKDSDR